MAYNRTYWENGRPPAIDSDNLNNIEDGIVNAHKFINNILGLTLPNSWMNLHYKEFPESTAWVAPNNILNNTVVVLIEGGGGGAAGFPTNYNLANGQVTSAGGGSGYIVIKAVSVVTGQSYSFIVGAGGIGGTDGANGGRGGTSSAFGLSAQGGFGGLSTLNGGNGESGGKGGGFSSALPANLTQLKTGNGGNGGTYGGGGDGGDILGTFSVLSSLENRNVVMGNGGRGGTLYGGGGRGGIFGVSLASENPDSAPASLSLSGSTGGTGGTFAGNGGNGKFFIKKANGGLITIRNGTAGTAGENAAAVEKPFPYTLFSRISSGVDYKIGSAGGGYGSMPLNDSSIDGLSGAGGFCSQRFSDKADNGAASFGSLDTSVTGFSSAYPEHAFRLSNYGAKGYLGYYGNGGKGVSTIGATSPGLPGVVAMWYYTAD